MTKEIFWKSFGLTLALVAVIWVVVLIKGGPSDEPDDRNEYTSERNKTICKYDVREIRISTSEGSEVAFKKMGNIWDGGDLSNDFIEAQLEEFCDIKIAKETDLEKLKGELEWIEDLEVVFVDGSSIQAKLSQNGVIQVGIRHYFAPSLLKLIQGSKGSIPDVNLEPEQQSEEEEI